MSEGVRNGDLAASREVPVSAAAEGMPEGRLTASRDAPLGGQAVLEGVMMRGVSQLGSGGAQTRRGRCARSDHRPLVPVGFDREARIGCIAGR